MGPWSSFISSALLYLALLCSALLGSISVDANGCVRLIDNDDSVQFCVLLIQSHLIYAIHWTVFFFLWLYFTLYRSLKSTDFHFLQLIRLDRFNAIANKGICFRETICFCVFCSQFNWFFCSWKHHWAMRLGELQVDFPNVKISLQFNVNYWNEQWMECLPKRTGLIFSKNLNYKSDVFWFSLENGTFYERNIMNGVLLNQNNLIIEPILKINLKCFEIKEEWSFKNEYHRRISRSTCFFHWNVWISMKIDNQ